MKSILLIGFMAAGKSYLAQKYSKKYNLQFFDTDQLIENSRKQSIAEIFSYSGEKAFRELEHETLAKLVVSHATDALIAAGGGVAAYKKNHKLFNRLAVVFLDADFELLKDRLAGRECKKRPLLENLSLQQFKCLFNKRRKIYFEFADYVIKSEDEFNELICKMKEEEKNNG